MAEPPAAFAISRPGRPLADTFDNVRAGVLLLLLRASGVAALRPGAGRFALLVVLALAVSMGADVALLGTEGARFDPTALPHRSFWVLAALAAAMVAGRGSVARFARAAVALAALALVGSALVEALDLAALADGTIERWRDGIAGLLLVWLGLAAMVAAWRIARRADGPAPGAGRIGAFGRALVTGAAVLTPLLVIDPAARLWVDTPPPAAAGDDFYGPTTSEDALYAQLGLLDAELAAVEPAPEGTSAMYFVGFAGFGPQDVFRREVEGAAERVAERFGTERRSVLLANDHSAPAAHPFASMTALNRTLGALADQMDPDRDVLFLLLSSHGRADGTLEVSMWPYRFASVTPASLREALDAAGIRHRVVVVSACHAGTYLQPLADPDTLVITASRADRTSFGCESGEDWTWFGRAFFEEALRLDDDLERVFRDAVRRVGEREQAEGRTPSEPQIAMGERIREHLATMRTQRPTPRKDVAAAW